MEDDSSRQLLIEPQKIPQGWMVAPRSYLVDRFTPDVEWISLPEASAGGGHIAINKGKFEFRTHRQGLSKGVSSLLSKRSEISVFGLIFDLRADSPENWSHFLNRNMSYISFVCRELDMHWSNLTILFPSGSPGYLREACRLLELNVAFTDGTVFGEGIRLEFSSHTVLRGEQVALLRDPRYCPVASAISSGKIKPDVDYPKRIFVPRRGSRSLKNQAAIEDELQQDGFVTVFPEDLSVDQEIAIFLNSDEIVGIAGAALAPIAYRDSELGPLKLVEIASVGHISNFFRGMIADTLGYWCSARGRLDADQVGEIYDLGRPFLRDTNRSFRVDPISVRLALDHLRQVQ